MLLVKKSVLSSEEKTTQHGFVLSNTARKDQKSFMTLLLLTISVYDY